MKINLNDVPMVIASYIDAEIMPKLSGLQKAAAAAIGFAATRRSSKFIEVYKPHMEMLGLITDDGMLDMDYARDMAHHSIQQNGGTIHALGYMFDRDDVEAMYAAASRQGVAHANGQV